MSVTEPPFMRGLDLSGHIEQIKVYFCRGRDISKPFNGITGDSNKEMQIFLSLIIVKMIWHAFSLLLPVCKDITISANRTDFDGAFLFHKMLTINDGDLRIFLNLFFQGRFWTHECENRSEKVARILAGKDSFLGINRDTFEELLFRSHYNRDPSSVAANFKRNLESELDEFIRIFRWAIHNISHDELKKELDEQDIEFYGCKITKDSNPSCQRVVPPSSDSSNAGTGYDSSDEGTNYASSDDCSDAGTNNYCSCSVAGKDFSSSDTEEKDGQS